MDELPNTHYIPSFFEVTPSGRQLIISEFHKIHPDIFVGYENNINAFFINTNDDSAISALLGIFAAQINLFLNGKYGDAPESPKMLPLKYTTLGGPNDGIPSTAQLTNLDLNLLIDLDEDSEESSDNSSLSGDSSTYWAPKSGNLGILQRDLVNGIANLTGCIFCPEPEHRRMRLVSGNTQAALAKLRRLEPLLEQLARHGSATIPRVDYNILSLSCESKGTGVCYVPTIRRPYADRIMVDVALEDRVESMYIGEEQMYNETSGKYTRAENLGVDHTKEEPAVASNIWADYQLQSFGDPENAQARVLSTGTSVVSSTNTIRPNENMGIIEQARVREWSKNIDACADPTQAVSIPAQSEPGVEEPTSVRVVAKSDSDDEDDAAEEVTHRVVAEDSDDEVPSSVGTKVQSSIQRNPRDLRPQENPIMDHPMPNTRTSRANRRTDVDVPIALRGHGTRDTTFVAANSFFADVPRDEDGRGEARFRATPPTREPTTTTKTDSRQGNTRSIRPNRGFGFDGTADEYDQDEHQSLKQAHSPPKSSTNNNLLTASRSQQSEKPNFYQPGPGFDPNQYNASRRGVRNFGRTYPTQQNAFASGQSQQRPVPTWPQPSMHGGVNAGIQRRGGLSAQPRRNQDQLIDCSEEVHQQPTNVMPPPGLSPIPRKRLEENDALGNSHIMDSPLDEIQKPSIKPSWDDNIVPQTGEPSVSTSSSSGTRRLFPDYNVQTKVNKPDIGYMRNDMVGRLMAIQQKRKSKKESPTIAENSSERIAPEDEATTRKFYNTMNLRAPNTGRGKKGRGGSLNSSNAETPAQARERIAKAKAELGLVPVPSQKPKPQTQNTEKEKERISKRAQQAAKSNPQMAKLHAGSLKEASRKRIALELVENMKDAYEVARLFPGHVDLEFQIGQLLVMPSPKFKSKVVYETDKWKSVFNSGVTSAEVFFTDLLTTSGSDVDGILEAKTEGTKIWSKEAPGPCSVVLEFECQDSSGSQFKLHLNTDGTHSMSKYAFVIQQIGLHCPGRTWDTCAVLKGVPAWHDIPEALQSSVTDLIASVYMRPGEQVDVFFRTPTDNSITVREVTVRRTSRHNSQLVGEGDIQLKIVEVKTLYMTNHKKDKRLTRCTEKEHDEMAQNDRVHFEVSVVDGAINGSLEQNQSLEVGEMTSLESSGSSPLNARRISSVLESALRLVDKIDWVGGCNLGTIVQQQYIRRRREQEVARNMPSTMLDHSFLRPAHLPSGLSVAGPRSVVGSRTVIGSTTGGNTLMSVHGIRSGTKAQIMTDGNGNFFRIGLGGARIPLDHQEEASINGEAVAPSDSASQIGASRYINKGSEARPDSFW